MIFLLKLEITNFARKYSGIQFFNNNVEIQNVMQ